MSGIVGIVNLDGAPVDQGLLRHMTDCLTFRGPDAQETWSDGAVGFGHTMLRTTYEAAREQQPCSLDGSVWITADARIDDRARLKAELEAHGRRDVRNATDVELILHSYHVWGEKCVQHLLGDFAFAIWDGSQRRLFCARDHFGVKPFYYARVGKRIVCSNTLNCVRAHPTVTAELNDLAIADFLLFGYNTEPATTTFVDIQRLPPAHTLTLADETLRIDRYWQLPVPDRLIRYEHAGEYVEHFKALLGEAVGDRLRTDRVSIFMSGGLDSPTIAATVCDLRARHALSVALRAYCVVYDESPDEERYYSQLVADELGIPIEHLVADGYQLFERWNAPELQRPEPYDSALVAMEYDSSRAAATHSRVVLYGEDGDALLFPASVVDMLRSMSLQDALGDVARYVVGQRRRPPLGLGVLARIKIWLGKQSSYPYPSWLNPAFEARLNLPAHWRSAFTDKWTRIHPVRPGMYRLLSSTLWQRFFESCDQGTRLVPLEFRLPLMDLRLVDFLVALPPLPWCMNKQLLRTAMKGTLPDPVRQRPKSPLAFDRYEVLLQRPEATAIDRFVPMPRLAQYVDRDAIPRVAGGNDNRANSWLNLRPLMLNQWLKEVEPLRPNAAEQIQSCR